MYYQIMWQRVLEDKNNNNKKHWLKCTIVPHSQLNKLQ